MGALGGIGIGLMVIGAGGVVGGSVLLSMGNEVELMGGDPTMTDERDYRRPGIGFLAGGTSILVAGAALLIADRIKARRAKKNLSITPALGRNVAGLSLSGRF